MSGTTSKVTGLVCENGSTVPTGTTLRLRWNAYAGADEYQLQASNDAGAVWQAWHRVTTTNTTKGGAADGAWLLRIAARKAGREIAGSASDPVTVRVGPVPVTQPPPAPAPTPAPTPTYATAANLAALAARVAALETAAANAVLPADLRRVGASTAAEEMVVVRAGEVVVATRG